MSNLWLGRGAQYDLYGGNTGQGTNVSKTSFTQIASSTTRAYESLIVSVGDNSMPAAGQSFDLGVGASGSEQILCPTIYFPQVDPTAGDHSTLSVQLPLAIPSGTRVAIRNNGGGEPFAGLIGVSGVPLSEKGFRFAEAMGFSTNIGTVVSPSATGGTYGSWTEITSSTEHNYAAIMACLGGNDLNIYGEPFQFDIGYGASGSQQPLVAGLQGDAGESTGILSQNYYGPFACDIPAGTALWARTVSVTSSPPTIVGFDLVLYGFVR
jgi:hypothetical protein